MRGMEAKGHRLLLVGIILCGGALRFSWLGQKSLWYDEALSDWFSRLPLNDLWGRVPGYETHPPLYYTLLKGWTLLMGNGEAGLRSLSALAGAGAILIVYELGRIAGGEGRGRLAGLFSAAIFALAPSQIVYSQEARPYALLVFSAMLALLGAMRLAADPPQSARPYLGLGSGAAWSWAALITGTALTLWFHNMGFTLALALLGSAAAGLLWKTGFSRAYILNAGLAAGAILLLYGPFIPWLLHQSGNVHASFWLKSITPALTLKRLDEVFFLYIPSLWMKGALICLAGFGFYVIHRERNALAAAVLAGAMIIPLALVIAISYIFTPVFVARTMIWAGVPLYIAMGAALAALAGRGWKACAPAALMVLAALLPGIWTHFHGGKEPWRDMARLIAEKAGPGDVALTLPNSAAIPFSYYSSRYIPQMKIIPLPAPFPAQGLKRPYPTGNMAEPGFIAEDSSLLDGIDCRNGSVWLVARFLPMFDPENRLLALLSEKCELTESAGNLSLKAFHFSQKRTEP